MNISLTDCLRISDNGMVEIAVSHTLPKTLERGVLVARYAAQKYGYPPESACIHFGILTPEAFIADQPLSTSAVLTVFDRGIFPIDKQNSQWAILDAETWPLDKFDGEYLIQPIYYRKVNVYPFTNLQTTGSLPLLDAILTAFERHARQVYLRHYLIIEAEKIRRERMFGNSIMLLLEGYILPALKLFEAAFPYLRSCDAHKPEIIANENYIHVTTGNLRLVEEENDWKAYVCENGEWFDLNLQQHEGSVGQAETEDSLSKAIGKTLCALAAVTTTKIKKELAEIAASPMR